MNREPVDIFADRRAWYVEPFVFLGQDFTGASFAMQVRQVKDTTDTPLLDLSNAGPGLTGINLSFAGTATIDAHIAAGRLPEVPKSKNLLTGLPYAGTDSVTLTQIVISIADNLLAFGFPFPGQPDVPGEAGDDFQGFHDLIVDTPAGVPQVAMAGKFILRAGVTIP